MTYVESYFESLQTALRHTSVMGNDGSLVDLDSGFDLFCQLSTEVKKAGSQQILCGNGASAAFANHMSLDWSKNGNVKTISFSDSALLTALANDIGAEEMFAASLGLYGSPGDMLVTISSSGNSPNILRAIAEAREMKMKVVTFSGLKPDNQSRALGDLNFYVPAKTYGIVECAHQVLLHIWLDHFMGIREWSRSDTQNMRASEFNL